MLTSTEHEISTANKTKIKANKEFSCFKSLRCSINMLISACCHFNIMSRINFVLSWVELKKLPRCQCCKQHIWHVRLNQGLGLIVFYILSSNGYQKANIINQTLHARLSLTWIFIRASTEYLLWTEMIVNQTLHNSKKPQLNAYPGLRSLLTKQCNILNYESQLNIYPGLRSL